MGGGGQILRYTITSKNYQPVCCNFALPKKCVKEIGVCVSSAAYATVCGTINHAVKNTNQCKLALIMWRMHHITIEYDTLTFYIAKLTHLLLHIKLAIKLFLVFYYCDIIIGDIIP